MRHQIAGKKLGRSSGHRTSLRRTLINEILEHERIHTTRAKALAVRGELEKLVTLAKRGIAGGDQKMVHARRVAAARLASPAMVKRLFDDIAPRYEKTNGGYTRVLRLGQRKGDAAEMVLLEFVE
ncbi:MAG: 50S ribosomal protein L17 [Anaerolineales bacterium]|nr:50S ribosomal protein L17 [Anaerolineales bacterium]